MRFTRDAELLVNLSVAAPVALLEALTVKVELWDEDRLVASHQQSPGFADYR